MVLAQCIVATQPVFGSLLHSKEGSDINPKASRCVKMLLAGAL
jgi:hypothetical protein